jgi:anthranilate synthase component 1
MMNPQQLKLGDVLPMVRTVDQCPDPLDLFVLLTNGGLRPDTLFLESGEVTSKQGEKSLLVSRCALRARCRGQEVEVCALNSNGSSMLPWLADSLQAKADVKRAGDCLTVRYPPHPSGSEEMRLRAPSPVDVLRTMAQGQRLVSGETSLGPLIVGVFAYDFLGVYESLPPNQHDPLGWPDYEFWLPDQMIWVNHKLRTTTMLAHVFGGAHASAVYNDATDAIAQMVDATKSLAADPVRHAPSVRSALIKNTPADLSDEEYAAVVERCKQHIIAGDVFQIVPSRTFSAACSQPITAYRRLRELNPSPYMFLVNSELGVLFGASPETAVKVDGKPRRVQIRPIAGTRHRGRRPDGSPDEDLDSRLEAELRTNEKEIAEHMMLVDLARNDVARVSEPGTRRVDRLLTVERYSHVMHLVSHVSGRLRHDLDALSAYVATMNMGTLTGAPKIKAAELLRHFEPNRRGPYGGAIGYFTMDGRMDTSIIIRSAVARDGIANVRAGAGIVYDSDPMAEAAETRRKAEAVLQAIGDTQKGAS